MTFKLVGTSVKTPMYCNCPPSPKRHLPAGNPERLQLIRRFEKKWVNGMTLKYHFLKSREYAGPADYEDVLREAFQKWKDQGIGLNFQEVDIMQDATFRIGFVMNDGYWSGLGTDVLRRDFFPPGQRTMNLGYSSDMTYLFNTALHEIGHSLGFPHEHQNPNAGIIWDEEAVYRDLAGPPNRWSREQTYRNIIMKIDEDLVDGGTWDKDSIMHYPFKAGMIIEPSKYRTESLEPAPGLSPEDVNQVKMFYPPLEIEDGEEGKEKLQSLELDSYQSANVEAGGQVNFQVIPDESRWYRFRTTGNSDTVMVLFEDDGSGNERQVAADDDSGYERNAQFSLPLQRGVRYVLRVRLYYKTDSATFGVLYETA